MDEKFEHPSGQEVSDSDYTIVLPLLREIRRDPTAERDVIIDLNDQFPGGSEIAQQKLDELLSAATSAKTVSSPLVRRVGDDQNSYVFARLPGDVLLSLVALDRANALREPARNDGTLSRLIVRIWDDSPVRLA